jgi:hypothetical protein
MFTDWAALTRDEMSAPDWGVAEGSGCRTPDAMGGWVGKKKRNLVP